MKLKLLIAVSAVVAYLTTYGDGDSSVNPFSATATIQSGSAYQLYGARFNDEPYLSYSASVDAEIPCIGTLGVGSWTMNDLTAGNRDAHSWWNNETDLDVHLYRHDEVADGWAFDSYVGHVWFLFYHAKGGSLPSQASFIAGTELDNPYVVPFVSAEYEYAYNPALYVEVGLKRRFEILNGLLTCTPSVSLSGMGGNFKDSFFPAYGSGYSGGIEALFARVSFERKVDDRLTVFLNLTACSLLDDDIRSAVRAASGSTYATDFALVEIGAKFEF